MILKKGKEMVLMHSYEYFGLSGKKPRTGAICNTAKDLVGTPRHDTLNIERYDSPEFRRERGNKAKPFHV